MFQPRNEKQLMSVGGGRGDSWKMSGLTAPLKIRDDGDVSILHLCLSLGDGECLLLVGGWTVLTMLHELTLLSSTPLLPTFALMSENIHQPEKHMNVPG